MSNSPYPKLNEKGHVVCQICGQAFKVIVATHLKKHEVSMDQYKQRFPEAPISSDEFKTTQKYAATTDLFKEKAIPKEKLEAIIDDVVYEFPEEVIVQEEPEIEELELDVLPKKAVKETTSIDPIKRMKNNIFKCLQQFYPNIQENFMIQKLSLTNHLEYEFITDFADPVMRINIEFPDTFWHNRHMYVDPTRNSKLMLDGWKVIEIHSSSPSIEKIENAIVSSF